MLTRVLDGPQTHTLFQARRHSLTTVRQDESKTVSATQEALFPYSAVFPKNKKFPSDVSFPRAKQPQAIIYPHAKQPHAAAYPRADFPRTTMFLRSKQQQAYALPLCVPVLCTGSHVDKLHACEPFLAQVVSTPPSSEMLN